MILTRRRFRWMDARRMRGLASAAALVLLAAGCGPQRGRGRRWRIRGRGERGRWACRITHPEITPGHARARGQRRGAGPADARACSGAHGDSGNAARALRAGQQRAAAGAGAVTGARNRDWEDMAIGPCPGGTCVYVGDIGNNLRAADGPGAVPRARPRSPGTRPRARRRGVPRALSRRGPRRRGAVRDAAGRGLPDHQGAHGARWSCGAGPRPCAPARRGPGARARARAPAAAAGRLRDGRGRLARTGGGWRCAPTAAWPCTARRTCWAPAAPRIPWTWLPLGEAWGEGVAIESDGTVLLVSEGRGGHTGSPPPGSSARSRGVARGGGFGLLPQNGRAADLQWKIGRDSFPGGSG